MTFFSRRVVTRTFDSLFGMFGPGRFRSSRNRGLPRSWLSRRGLRFEHLEDRRLLSVTNVAPTGFNDTLSNVAEDSGTRTISFASLLGNDSPGPASESDQTLTITAVNNPVGGTVSISGTNVLFAPTANYNGSASFTYTLQDNGQTNGVDDFKTATATASFTITEVNDAPTGVNDTLANVPASSPTQTISFSSLLVNDSLGPANESAQTLTITGVSSPVGGTVSISGTNVLFTPTANFVGSASFSYTLQDNGQSYRVGLPQGNEFRVNNYTTGAQNQPSVAVDSAGNYVIAWQSKLQDGSDYGIYAQRYNAAGAAQGSVFQVNTYTTNSQYAPSVAIDAAGDFVITWVSTGQDGSSDGIYAQRYNAAGAAQGSEFRVNTTTTSPQFAPSVAIDAAGNFVIAWDSVGQDNPNDNGIFAQRFNAAGVPQGSEFQVNTYTSLNQIYPSVAVDTAGNFVIAWTSMGQDGIDYDFDFMSGNLIPITTYGIFAQRYSAAGVPQGSEFQVNTFTTGDQRSPSVALDAAGNFVIAWQCDSQDGSGFGIYAQRYNAAGVAQGSEFQVNTYTSGSQINPSVAADTAGNFVIAWQSDVQSTDTAAQRYNAAGVPQDNEFQVNTYTTDFQGFPSVALNAAGDFLIAWQSRNQDGDSYGVYAQRFNSNSAGLSNDFKSATATASFQLTGVNQAPTLTAITKALRVAEDQTLTLGGISGLVSDVDAGNGNILALLSVQHGTLTIGTSVNGGVTSGQVTGNGSNSVTVSATLAQINATFAIASGASYRGLTDYFGSDVLSIVVNDLGNSGSGGALTASQTAAITVNSVNDAPVGGDDTLAGILPNSPTQTISFTSLIVNDSPGPANESDQTLTITGVSNPVGGTVSISGTNVLFAPTAGFVGTSSFTYTLQDIVQSYVVGVPQGNEFLVNTYTTNSQQSPSVAVGSAGDFVIAWNSFTQDGSDHGIYAQRYNAAGAPQGSEFRVNTYTSDQQNRASVAVDADGDFVIAWQSRLQDGSIYGIYAQRYNASGVAQVSEFQVNTYTTSNQMFPSVSSDTAGNFVITWQSQAQDGSGDGVYAQRYNAAGVTQGSEFLVNTYTTASQMNPRVAVNAAGDFVIAWASNTQDASNYGIYAQRYNAAGVPQGSEFRANAYTTGYQYQPSVAIDTAGNFVITWQSLGQDGSDLGVYAQRYNAAGEAQGSEFQVNTYTTGKQGSPSVTVDAAGDFVIAWYSFQDGGSGGPFGPSGIYAQRYNAAGVPQGSEFLVNTYTTNEQTSPSIAADSAGDFVITWQSSDIYAQRYTTGLANDSQSVTVTARFQSTQNTWGGGTVTLTPPTATVTGTPSGDNFKMIYDSATAFRFFINNVLVPASQFTGMTNVIVIGNGGSDQLEIYSHSGTTDHGDISPHAVNWNSTNIDLTSNTMDIIYAFGQNADSTSFYDGPGDDMFIGLSAYSIMQGTGYFNENIGFGTTYAFDSALGNDNAQLYDSAGNETYYGLAGYSIMQYPGNFVETIGFVNNYAFSSFGGTDTGSLYDSANDDTYYGLSAYSIMSHAGYINETIGFDINYAYSNAGGNDTALLYGTAGSETLNALPTYSILSGAALFNQAIGFKQAIGYGGGGSDTAMLYDGAGADTLSMFPTYSVMVGSGFLTQAVEFASVFGFSSTGYDTAQLFDSTGNDALTSFPGYVLLSGSGYLIEAVGFANAIVDAASGGVDSAQLFDSTGADTLTVSGSEAVLQYSASSGNRRVTIKRFENVLAHRTTGSDNLVNAAAIDYLLTTTGGW